VAEHVRQVAISCPLCGAGGPVLYYHESGYRYLRCPSCRLLFLWPRPSGTFLKDHYQEYLSIEPAKVRQWGEEMAPVIRSAARFLSECLPERGRILDIGCGYGFFLEEMRRRGWTVEGVELSQPAAAIARRISGGEIHSCAVEEMGAGSRFDVVTLFYVIEHVGDPVAVLRSVREILAPHGLLLLRYPNTTPLIRLCPPLARRLRLMQAPSHLYDFSAQAVHRMLAEAGFAWARTTLDGNTRPASLVKRALSCYIGGLSALIARGSRDRFLVPGVSRTTYASLQPDLFPRMSRIRLPKGS
jgi:2-polyprenyl-3-methyl-5-hydroxy-6-metoxy-1,4-benzoquinol methylase